VTGRPLGDHLAEDLFAPLGMTDAALWVPEGKLDRLPAAYRPSADGLVETEPGTDFFIDRDETVGILFTQVELGAQMWAVVEEFQGLHEPSS
jgi:CubicO group peptidase (beta-lactamase class C family)